MDDEKGTAAACSDMSRCTRGKLSPDIADTGFGAVGGGGGRWAAMAAGKEADMANGGSLDDGGFTMAADGEETDL